MSLTSFSFPTPTLFGPGVHPNPIEQDVAEAAQACQAGKCDGVVAFGGGSPLDVDKAARLLFAAMPFPQGEGTTFAQ